ncbi:MAG: hypothetical protein HY092_02380 [Candidatus Kerfeldbacteria bacterium]|nr:hypothetical protein [Candidatus Kerfeldbacteria bacterium]
MSAHRPTIKPLLSETYVATIKNSVGVKTFQQFFAMVNNRKKNIVRGGELSCAWFVSTLLHAGGLIRKPHTTVEATLKDMQQSGWRRIRRARPGCVILWARVRYPDGQEHQHLGFLIGVRRAVSNSSRTKVPQVHHWTFGRRGRKLYRPVTAMYWHPKLNS